MFNCRSTALKKVREATSGEVTDGVPAIVPRLLSPGTPWRDTIVACNGREAKELRQQSFCFLTAEIQQPKPATMAVAEYTASLGPRLDQDSQGRPLPILLFLLPATDAGS